MLLELYITVGIWKNNNAVLECGLPHYLNSPSLLVVTTGSHTGPIERLPGKVEHMHTEHATRIVVMWRSMHVFPGHFNTC